MKYILGVLLISGLFVGTSAFVNSPNHAAQPEELKWYSNIEEAHAMSLKTNRPIFGFFTGSDWCGWCHRLQATVFNKPTFKEWASKNVILLELDFPRRKQLPALQAQQNNELKNFFGVQGFPTVWIFDMKLDAASKQYQINAMGSLGYPRSEEGKEDQAFIATANQILAQKGQK
ncbi:MAG: thioredoxin family protein [Flavobacteriales bacterium]|nr:thioredoxin family protein [Flavobacteriales bacterium]